MGIPATHLLRADPIERATLLAAAVHARDFHAERDRALAQAVIYELAEALKRGK